MNLSSAFGEKDAFFFQRLQNPAVSRLIRAAQSMQVNAAGKGRKRRCLFKPIQEPVHLIAVVQLQRTGKLAINGMLHYHVQHGTAVVVGAALINAVRCAGKQMKDVKVVINGAGAAGIAIGSFLLEMGIGDLIMVDINGIINKDDKYENPAHAEIATRTNKDNIKGKLADAMKGADVFIGVSRPGLVTEDMVKSMADKPIVFAMANPEPEIMPDKALEAGAFIVGTGRSDFPNQINNVLVFPGIFKGALQCGAKAITEEMKKAAAYAIADIVTPDKLSREYIIPSPLDKSVAQAVADAVAKAAQQ